MSKNPSSPRTPARFSPGFFTWRKRYGSNLEAPRGAATARPTSTVSYLSTDFDAIDVSKLNALVILAYSACY